MDKIIEELQILGMRSSILIALGATMVLYNRMCFILLEFNGKL